MEVSETSQAVGANVAQLRRKAGMTQAQLASAIDVATPRISEIESGRHNPTVDTLDAVAKALQVPVARLFHQPKIAS